MRFFNPKNKTPFIIAEVGQNHQGNEETAREYVRVFANLGADAVKFQTRDIDYLFSNEALAKDYNSNNAFGSSYGEHRRALELDVEFLAQLKKDCEEHNLKFISTPFDEPSLERLIDLDVDMLKIASFDLGNLPFIDKIAASKKPVIMSVGGGKASQIKSSVDAIRRYHNDVCILHCVSDYPCPYDQLGLENIQTLIEAYPDLLIGLSDHFNGILSGPIAYMAGASV